MRINDDHKARLVRMKSDDVNKAPKSGPDVVVVQFNPTSLSYSAQNTLEKKGKDASASQFVSQTSAKLEFDLVFDTTHDGSDVRKETDRIKHFLDTNPDKQKKPPSEPAPPRVGFIWGSFTFVGMLESFRETLDFFSAEGVPLRSSVKVAMSSLSSSEAFRQQTFTEGQVDAMSGAGVKLATTPARGAPSRPAAKANGLESMRNPGAGLMAVASAGVELKAAASFSAGASAGFSAGAGAGFGAGAGASAGFGAGASAGFGAGAGASAGFSGGASAGFGAGAGASAGFGGGASAGLGAGAGASAGFGASAGASFGASAGAGFSSSTSSFSSSSFSSTSFASSSFTTSSFASSGGSFGFASASASRGVSASMGAFAGLGPSRVSTTRVDLVQSTPTPVIGTATADFAIGGRVVGTASAGLKADVGPNARIRFD